MGTEMRIGEERYGNIPLIDASNLQNGVRNEGK